MKKNNRRKKAVVAASALLLMSAAGTFAWNSISQRALNENSSENNPGGRIHDDYEKESGNKNIYAENYGEQNLLVRIKLSEYLSLNGQSLIDGAEKNNRKTWEPLRVQEVEARGGEGETSTWTLVPTGNSAEFSPYVTWILGGEKTYLPTFLTDNESLTLDTTGDAIDEIAGALNNGVSNAETPGGQTGVGNGTLDYFKPGLAYDKDGNVVTPTPEEPTDAVHIAKETVTQERAPISMNQWKQLPEEEQTGNYWVLDENDGWAYWANYLNSGQATSMLLKQLNWQPRLEDYEEWYYGMDVTGQFASISDYKEAFGDENGGMSLDAKMLLALITNDETPDPNGYYPPAKKLGDTFKLDGQEFIYLDDLEEGNYLVLRKEITEKVKRNIPEYFGGPVEGAMNTYYDNLTEKTKAMVQPVMITAADNDFVKVDLESGKKRAFALSLAEIKAVTGEGLGFSSEADRLILGSAWWTRTRNGSSLETWIINGYDGALTARESGLGEYGVRPALVIHPTGPLPK